MRKNKILILALLVCLSIPVRAQNTDNNIIGIVVDKSGNPVYGASVNVEGGAVETRVETDKDGKFEIAVEKGQRLSVVSVDKGSTTVVAKTDGPMTIVMGYAAQTIDVGANRTFNRHESTAAVSTTYNEEFNKRSSRNISNSLYGYGLGLTTLQNAASTGLMADPTFYVRGLQSLSSSTPLVLVDGLERDMSLVSPEEVESVSILKDAAAVAGLVGEDGPTHHGAFDMACLRPIPNLTISSPMDEHELRRLMYTAQLPDKGPFVIRYPRGRGVLVDWKCPLEDHGALAERALRPVIPSEEEFPYSLRLVSEVLSSNGSTSQASVCGSTLSLMAAGVPIKRPVAGISCGLVTGDTDDDFILLTDIQGLEDFFGDMDFKVTGTTEGITAIQMDIKIHGLTRPIVEEAIRRTREARLFIMDTCMKPAIAEPRKTVGEFAPKIIQTTIDPAKIGEVVGQRGKVINAIIEECGVKIDITDDGFVSVCGVDQAGMDKAMKYIRTIVDEFEEGKIYEGKVVSIKEFGAFVEFAPGKEGMVHISKISKERINMVEDVLTLGDVVKCKCMGKDKMGRISFSIKDAE